MRKGRKSISERISKLIGWKSSEFEVFDPDGHQGVLPRFLPVNQTNRIAEWNRAYKAFQTRSIDDWRELEDVFPRTRKGYLCDDRKHTGRRYGVELHITESVAEMIVHKPFEGQMLNCRIQFRHSKGKVRKGGAQAWRDLTSELKKDGVDWHSLRHEFDMDIIGEEKRKALKLENEHIMMKYVIDESVIEKPVDHCYHFDMTSAFPHFFSKCCPKTRKTFERLAAEKDLCRRLGNEDGVDRIKDIFNKAIGYMASDASNLPNDLKGRLTRPATASRRLTRKALKEFTAKAKENGYEPILFNTDGVWMRLPPEKDFGEAKRLHEELKGRNLGEWRCDHANCVLKIKKGNRDEDTGRMPGTRYAFMENGKLNVVITGLTPLDKVKDRELWDWDDFDHCGEMFDQVGFDPKNGLYMINTEGEVLYE